MSFNVLVGQSGGPTAAINASLAGVYTYAKQKGAKKVYGMVNGIQGLIEGKIIDLDTQFKDDLYIEVLKRTPSSFLGSCRYKLKGVEEARSDYESIFSKLKEYEIDIFLYIGGNDSMDTIKKLSAYAKERNISIKFVGVPKTIDNDLAVTDHTPGFGSAAKYIATSVKELIRDALVYDIGAITIVEIMGRNAGWLTASAALAKGEDCEGPDLLYLPEKPFDAEDFIAKVKKLQEKKSALLIAVSEGLRFANGKYVCDTDVASIDAFGHKMLSGTGLVLANILRDRLSCKTRAVELSTLQRCASHLSSLTDITEAFMAGEEGVKAGLLGNTGVMICFRRTQGEEYKCETFIYDVNEIANKEKTVPDEFILEGGAGVSELGLKYLRPLIAGESEPIMCEGLPRHIVRNSIY